LYNNESFNVNGIEKKWKREKRRDIYRYLFDFKRQKEITSQNLYSLLPHPKSSSHVQPTTTHIVDSVVSDKQPF
jgi:hypothetical protein